MLFSDLFDKEVINVNASRGLGNVRDVEFDKECGHICAIIVPGPGKFFGCFGREFNFCIPWVNIVRIGPDIILVELDEREMKKKI